MDEQQKKNKKILLTIVGVAIVVVALVGVTYAFFNYTRTGGANTVRTGRILFNTEEGENINLTNVFPVASGQASDSNPNVRTLNITVTGDTDYADGLEYLVTAEDVQMRTIGNKEVPLRVDISVSDIATGENAGSLGTEESGDYFANKASYKPNGNTPGVNKYKVLYTDNGSNSLNDGERLLVGYIAPNTTPGTASGVSGVIKIKVYFDGDRIAISDTYNETTPETDEYGTTTNWVRGREVFTTSEWNALSSNGVSFKIKVEANEGQWVPASTTPAEPSTPVVLPTCPGCKFMYTTNQYDYGTNGSTLADIAQNNDEIVDNYEDLLESQRTYFLGLKIENEKVAHAYACGVKAERQGQDTVFCLERTSDSQSFTANKTLANTLYGNYDEQTEAGCWEGYNDSLLCNDSISWTLVESNYTIISGDDYEDGGCKVFSNGKFGCY